MAVPLIAFAALAALQMINGNAQAAAIREQGRRKQLIANMNAEFAELDAYEAEVKGFSDTARYQNVIDSTIGAQRVGYAAAGVDVNYGTAKDVQTDTRITGLLNTLDIQKQARQKALGFKKEARNLRMGGDFSRQQAGMDATATSNSAYMNAAGTMLQGADKNVSFKSGYGSNMSDGKMAKGETFVESRNDRSHDDLDWMWA